MPQTNAPELSVKSSFDRILDAAEILFAENGYKACTFRQISVAGGVNQGLLHYHFTSKENLFRTAFLRRAEPLTATRMTRLQNVTSAAGGTPSLEAIVRGYIEPVLEMYKLDAGHRAFLRIHAQLRVDPLEFSLDLRRQAFGASTSSFMTAVHQACPHLSPAAVGWRFQALIGAYHVIVSGGGRSEDFLKEAGISHSIDDAMEQVIAFSVAGLMAPDRDQASTDTRALRGT